MNDDKTTRIEAATFRRLIKHFQENPKFQNIDLMEVGGFCRNCLSKWYSSEAEKIGETINYDNARELVYGMPYDEWKSKNQTDQPKSRIDKLNKLHNK